MIPTRPLDRPPAALLTRIVEILGDGDAARGMREAAPACRAVPWTTRPPPPPVPALARWPQATWHAQGVVELGRVVDAISALQTDANALLDAAFASSGMRSRGAWRARVKQLPCPESWCPRFAALRDHPSLRAAAAAALGAPQAVCVDASVVIKPPDGRLAVPWHTDRPTWGLPTGVDAVVAWLAIDAVGPQSGGLIYRPGSHLHPSDDALRPTVPAGHALLHHGDVLHCSPRNQSSDWRRAWVGVFTSVADLAALPA